MRSITCAAAGFIVLGTALAADTGDTSLFDGKTLTGWHSLGGGADYKVVDGTIVGSSRPGVPNSFLVTDRNYGDFILELDTRQEGGPTNSGIQFRSKSEASFENGRVHGYQTDIDPSERAWSGGIYDEAQRGWFYTGEMNPPAKLLYKYGEWNHYRLEAIGPQLRVWINGQPAAHVIDDVLKEGFIGLQVHSIEKPEDAGRTTSWKNLSLQTKNLKPAPPMGIFIRNLIPNNLDPQEKAQGWRLLWDGKSGKGWHSARGSDFPSNGWSMQDGVLAVQPKVRGGDIITDQEFGAFELQLEFMISNGANSGIIYLLTSPFDQASGAPLGLEYQILDDENHPDAKLGIDGNRTIASLYDIFPRAKLMTNVGVAPKVGAWQHARIVSRADGSVEHWLNGVKVLEFNRNSPEFKAKVATSKFKSTPNFGTAPRGRILLQDHGDDVRFRSIKIREL
ncbi:MAG: DUF1080 domain-containing protein [Povalibacter sp.]